MGNTREKLSDRLPDIEIISNKMCTHIKNEVHGLSQNNKQGERVPFDLIHGNSHLQQMRYAFLKSMELTVAEITKGWNSDEIKELIDFLNLPGITLKMANSIHNKFADIKSFDYGVQLEKNFGEIIMISALPIFINELKEKIILLNPPVQVKIKKFREKINDILGVKKQFQ